VSVQHKASGPEAERETERETERERDRDRDRETDRERERDRGRERQREGETRLVRRQEMSRWRDSREHQKSLRSDRDNRPLVPSAERR
jgi:hypothetical protein